MGNVLFRATRSQGCQIHTRDSGERKVGNSQVVQGKRKNNIREPSENNYQLPLRAVLITQKTLRRDMISGVIIHVVMPAHGFQ